MDNSDYYSFRDKVSKELKDKVRFAPIEERKDTGELSCETLCSLSHGNNDKDFLILSYGVLPKTTATTRRTSLENKRFHSCDYFFLFGQSNY